MDGSGFFEPESLYTIMARCFSIWYFFSVFPSKLMCIFIFNHSSSLSNSFFHVAYPFGFFVMFSWLPYFSPKLFGFSCIRLLVCFRVFSPNLLVEFTFVVLECTILSVLFYPVSISFLSSFFCYYLLVYFLEFYRHFFLSSFFPFCPKMLQCFSFLQSFFLVLVDFLCSFSV